MDYSRSSLLNLSPYFCHGKSVEELGQSWLCTTVELESLRMQAQEEIRRRDEQLEHVKELLFRAMVERDEAVQKCQTLQAERLLLQQQQLVHSNQMQQQQLIKEIKNTAADPLSGHSSIEDEPVKPLDSNNISSSDCDESIVSSPAADPVPVPAPIIHHTHSKLQSFHEEVMERLLLPDNNRPLPEKGKLLQAVMNAGPLLQTLLLAGPLPQWRHPPPPLDSFEIPPVTININSSSKISRKRGLTSHCSDSPPESHKLQKQHTLLHQ
uniref:Uncharacterized protein n=1 Tax=Kalanchoe fedtschenkoi TaxID=63787 RepID=A0A7N0VEP5_KALFE